MLSLTPTSANTFSVDVGSSRDQFLKILSIGGIPEGGSFPPIEFFEEMRGVVQAVVDQINMPPPGEVSASAATRLTIAEVMAALKKQETLLEKIDKKLDMTGRCELPRCDTVDIPLSSNRACPSPVFPHLPDSLALDGEFTKSGMFRSNMLSRAKTSTISSDI